MAFEELTSQLTLDATGFESGADDAIAASGELQDSAGGVQESLIDIEPAGLAAGGALAGLGTAMQSVLDDTQELRESLGRTAVSTDMTREETSNLAREMQDATFPMDDVVGTMDSLAQQGVDTEEEMQDLATASDALADATGTSAESVAQNLAPAIKGLDGDLSGLEEKQDAYTLAVRNTALDTEDLAQTMERSRDELSEMGVTSDEAAGLIAAYGEETGKSGRQLRRDFSSALRDADGDMDAFKRETGLSEDVLKDWEKQLEDSEGATQEYADAANESLSTMDHLRAGFDDAKLALSEYLGPVSAAAPALQGLGVAAMAMSTINFSAVIPSILGVTAAAAPLLPILLPIAGILAGIGIAWKKGWINPVETATWATGKIRDALAWLKDAVMEYHPLINGFQALWESNFLGIQDTVGAVTDMIGDAIDWIVEKVNKIPGVDIGSDEVEAEIGVDDSSGALADGTVPDDAGGFTSGGTRSSSGGSQSPQDDVPAPPSSSPPSSSSSPAASSSGPSRSDLRKAFSDALSEWSSEAVLEMLLDVDGRELNSIIDDRVDAKFQEVDI